MLIAYLARVAGFIVVAAILHDAFEVMLLPRRVKSRVRIVRYFLAGFWLLWRAIGRRIRQTWKHHFLGLFGPLSLVILLMVWAANLIAAFGAIYWGLNWANGRGPGLPEQLYFSGVTFFTLGYGDLVPHEHWSKLLSVLEAGTGFGFIAMVIGYLPVLYQLFSRRETHVLMLDAVAGSPPSAVTLLSRHAEGRSLANLDQLFANWQQWSAELLESQLSYPMLAYYRSQHDNQSWLAALTAVIDSTVLVMVGFDGVPTFQATLTFATARLALVEMGRVLGVNPLQPDADRLSSEAFLELQKNLQEAGMIFVDEAGAEERLTAFRNTYEPFVNGLAEHLLLALPPWASEAEQMDNWVRTPRGKTAKRLVESVPAEPEGATED